MAPEWDALADVYSRSSSVLIGSVDCTTEENGELCRHYGVTEYPTLKYFIDGNTQGEVYTGDILFNALESFAFDALEPSSSDDKDEL